MITTAKIIGYHNGNLIINPCESLDRELLQKNVVNVEIRLNDGRRISAIQRSKIFAIIRDIAIWSGHEPEYIRQLLTWDFASKHDIDVFSLSNVDMTTAKDFITWLIEFCFIWQVPTKDCLLYQSDDVGKYLYL
jgi:hypothetical protein